MKLSEVEGQKANGMVVGIRKYFGYELLWFFVGSGCFADQFIIIHIIVTLG